MERSSRKGALTTYKELSLMSIIVAGIFILVASSSAFIFHTVAGVAE